MAKATIFALAWIYRNSKSAMLAKAFITHAAGMWP
jgi:hypothetical protein